MFHLLPNHDCSTLRTPRDISQVLYRTYSPNQNMFFIECDSLVALCRFQSHHHASAARNPVTHSQGWLIQREHVLTRGIRSQSSAFHPVTHSQGWLVHRGDSFTRNMFWLGEFVLNRVPFFSPSFPLLLPATGIIVHQLREISWLIRREHVLTQGTHFA